MILYLLIDGHNVAAGESLNDNYGWGKGFDIHINSPKIYMINSKLDKRDLLSGQMLMWNTIKENRDFEWVINYLLKGKT